MSEVKYWTLNANADQMTAAKSVLISGQGLFPSAVDNGIISMPDLGLAMVLGRLHELCARLEEETQEDADIRMRETLLGLQTVEAALAAFGFTMEEGG